MLLETINLLIMEFLDQKISNIGMITAQNPQDIEHEEDFNSMSNDALLKDIQQLGYEPFPTYYYGEDGYLIPGISKGALINLGQKYCQKSVIWGQKVPEDRNGLTFAWQYIEDGKVRGEKVSNHPFVCPQFDQV